MSGPSPEFIPTRRSLISRLKNWDDKESWRDFFNTYWQLLYGYALKSGLSEAEAQDVVQETIIAVAKKIPGFKYDPAVGSFKGWLLHMTRWKVADQFRRRARHPGVTMTPSTGTDVIERIPDSSASDLEHYWDNEWEKNLFEAALTRVKNQVNPKQYQIFDLYVLKQWPVEKVATALSVNAGQVYLAKTRISALLKKEVAGLQSQNQ